MKEGKPMIFIKIKDLFLQPFKQRLIMLSILTILSLTVIAYLYLNLTTYNQNNNETFEASGSINVDFNVFYIENYLYPDNPMPQNLNFFMSFTDFIEVESRIFARFSEEVEAHSTYTSAKRLIIRHRGSVSDEINPIVYEHIYPLSYINDSTVGLELSLPDAGAYTIFPEQFFDIYLDFVEEYERLNFATGNQANFFAELHIEFNYDISIPARNITESVTASYHLPLTEVYSFVSLTDNSTFSQSLDLSGSQLQATLPFILLFVIAFSLSSYLLFKGIKNMQNESDEFNNEFSKISKKYADEIIESDESLLPSSASTSPYTCIKVLKFESLLNLAINSNEQIISYQNDERAEFVVVKGDFMYYYEILFNS